MKIKVLFGMESVSLEYISVSIVLLFLSSKISRKGSFSSFFSIVKLKLGFK